MAGFETSKPVIIFGTGQLADLTLSYFQLLDDLEIRAFCSDETTEEPRTFRGFPLLTTAQVLHQYPPANFDMFVAISYHKRNTIRRDKVRYFKAQGYSLISYVHPSASQMGLDQLGENCLVLEQVVIQPGSHLSDNVILWSGVQVGHHSTIEQDVFVSAGAVLMGCNRIGAEAHIGANVTIRDHVTIGARNVIGPSAYVSESTPEGYILNPQ